MTYYRYGGQSFTGGTDHICATERVEDIARVRGEEAHVTTEDLVIDSVVGETVSVVEPTVVLQLPPTPIVARAPKDPSLMDSYSTHVASLIWQ